MKKYLIILTILLVSCSKKEIKLPKVPLNGIEEINNHSQIWIFYNEKEGKINADLNEKNRISTTHWLFNIDRRLPIKEVLPIAVRLLDKHNNKSPHSVEGMQNYFSYANKLNDKLSFYSFDSIQYHFIKEKGIPFYKKESDTVLMRISKTDIDLNFLKKRESLLTIQTVFNDDLTFQDYLLVKSKFENENVNLSSDEYIVSK